MKVTYYRVSDDYVRPKRPRKSRSKKPPKYPGMALAKKLEAMGVREMQPLPK